MSDSPYAHRLVDPELLDLLAALPTVTLTIENLQEWRAVPLPPSWVDGDPALAVVRSETRSIKEPKGGPAVQARIYQPLQTSDTVGCVFHIHGGGFVSGGPAEWEPLHRKMCLDLGCLFVSVDYRLAPETRFPDNIEDCYAGLSWVFKHAENYNVDRRRIGVMGESAGGGLAAALALLVRDRGEFRLSFQHLIYPMLDDRTCLRDDLPPLAGKWVWTQQNNSFGWTALLGQEPGSVDVSPYAAPARAKALAGLPPTFISTGELDLFAVEDMEYARRLRHAGVAVELHAYPGAFHGFDLHPTAQVALAARRDSLAALKRFLSGSGVVPKWQELNR